MEPIRFARILICFNDSSPEIYSTLRFASASFWQTCRSNVDFPMPGSPPTKVREPGTIPPPSTLSSSPIPALIRSSLSKDTSDRREGSVLLPPLPAAPVFTEPPMPFAVTLILSSTIVFHALQAGHCPVHFADSCPHSWQKNRVVFFPFAILFPPAGQRKHFPLPASVHKNRTFTFSISGVRPAFISFGSGRYFTTFTSTSPAPASSTLRFNLPPRFVFILPIFSPFKNTSYSVSS